MVGVIGITGCGPNGCGSSGTDYSHITDYDHTVLAFTGLRKRKEAVVLNEKAQEGSFEEQFEKALVKEFNTWAKAPYNNPEDVMVSVQIGLGEDDDLLYIEFVDSKCPIILGVLVTVLQAMEMPDWVDKPDELELHVMRPDTMTLKLG